jgi:hypothetical protein
MIYSEEGNIFHPSYFLSLIGPRSADPTTPSHPISMAWNGSSNRFLCCYDEDDGIYYWDLDSFMIKTKTNHAHHLNSGIAASNRFTHHHITGTNSNDTIEMCTVSWLTIPSCLEKDAEKKGEEANDEMREYIVSLSHPFHLFICDLEGNIFASYSGFDGNIASHILSLPPLIKNQNLSSPTNVPSAKAKEKSGRGIHSAHSNVDLTHKGWRPLSDLSFSPRSCDEEGSDEIWKEAQGDFDVSSPCGSRILVVKSEVCLQLFSVTTNVCPNSSSSQDMGTKSFPPYRFELVTELNISIPIVTLSLIPLLGSAPDSHHDTAVVLLSCFDGPLKTIVVEVLLLPSLFSEWN